MSNLDPVTLTVIQNGLIPVFVDVRLGDYNADPDQLRAATVELTRRARSA